MTVWMSDIRSGKYNPQMSAWLADARQRIQFRRTTVWLALFLILAFSSFVLGAILCLSSAKVGLAFICVCGLTLLVILRQDQLAAVVLVATGLVLDWFIGTHILAVVAGGLL